MDIAINDVYIPDFDSMRFIKRSVGIADGKIVSIEEKRIDAKKNIDGEGYYLTPGLIDCHCHIESSHLLPSRFGNEIAKCGTLHAVCDCHEISNVKGKKGLQFFMNEAKNSLCNLKFAVPSCVPATEFATNGGKIDVDDVEYFMRLDDVVALGELMNVTGVANREDKFMKMIAITKKYKKRVNGHAPHLSGELLDRYISAGVEDDHESETYEELKNKIEKGLYVFIREGSAEKTKDDAYKIIEEYPDRVMFCSDDKTIGDIISQGHINYNLKKAVSLGIEPILAVKVATYNGLSYYGLNDYNEVKEGKRAYLVLFDKEFNAVSVIANGELIGNNDVNAKIPDELLDTIWLKRVDSVPDIENSRVVMGVSSGSLITERIEFEDDREAFDLENDLLKLCVFERYGHNNKSACIIKGFGLKKGAIASSLSHDCHNIIAVGTSDEAIKEAVNKIIENRGGLSLFDGEDTYILPFEVGGIVSLESGEYVSKKVEELKIRAKKLGCKLEDAFATLSFMALEVIPHLKLTDRGLFNVDKFEYE